MSEKIAVSGSRTNDNYGQLVNTLNRLLEKHPDATLLTGCAKGTDEMTRTYAARRGQPLETYEARWKELGRSAGPARNSRMLKQATQLLAMWDGKSKGTAHAIREAKRLGLPTTIIATK